MKKFADVVVVGGGIIGTAITYNLAKEKVDVTLVERDDIAKGSTGATGGSVGVLSMLMGPPEQDLALMSWDLYQHLPEELEFDFEFRKLGGIVLLRTEDKLAIAKELITKQKETKQELALLNENRVLEIEPFTLLDVDELKQREPSLITDNLLGAFLSQKGHVNPFLTTQALVNAAKRRGASVCTYTEVKAIRLKNQRIESVVTDRGEIKTEFVVNAAGAWSPFIGKMVGVEIPVIPRKGQEVITEPVTKILSHIFMDEAYLFPPSKSRRIITHTLHLDEKRNVHLAMKQTKNGNILIGVSSESKGYDVRSEPEVIKAIVQGVIKLFPILKDVGLLRAFAGLRPVTDDGLPILGKVEGIEGFLIATGAQTEGMAQAPATGKLISGLITGAKPAISMDAFSFSRFRKAK